MPFRRLTRTRTDRTLLAALIVVSAWGGWVLWGRFRRSGVSIDAGAVQAFVDGRISAASDGVYRVRMGQLHIDPARHAARVDTVVVTTDTARNDRLARPYPVLRLVLTEAEVRGLVLGAGGGIRIDEIRFSEVSATITFPRRGARGPAATPRDTSPALLTWSGALPEGAPEIRVGRILLLGMTATIRSAPGSDDPDQRFERLRLVLDSLRLDPRREGVTRPAIAHDLRVLLSNYSGGWDSTTILSVGEFTGSFRDSTLRGGALAFVPARTDAGALFRKRWRADRFTVRVDSVRGEGVDWRAAVREGSIPIRKLTLDGPDLVVFSDKRRPLRPGPIPRRPILQQTLTRFGRRIELDTLEFRNGRVRYREHPPIGEKVGEVDFQELNGTLAGLHWDPAGEGDEVTTLSLRGRLWGVGRMALSIRGPASSPTPRAQIDLFVGPMPLALFNQIASQVSPIDIKDGWLDSARVRATLAGDRAIGEARPYYRDLSIRQRSTSGGVFGWIKRSAGTVVANSFVVRDENPDGEGTLMVGPIDRVREPGRTFWPFAWTVARDGLLLVATGKGIEVRP